jgi:hypothetical protein
MPDNQKKMDHNYFFSHDNQKKMGHNYFKKVDN